MKKNQNIEYFQNAEIRREAVKETSSLLMKGESIKFIQDYLVDKYKLSTSYIRECFIHSVKKEIARATAQNLSTIIPSHILIYEELYKYFDERNHIGGKMITLKNKEKLLGLHKDKNTIEINNRTTTTIEKEMLYNEDNLSFDEKQRLNQLINKAKK